MKKNQGKLRKAVEDAFAVQRAKMPDKPFLEYGHGRIDCRQSYIII